MEIARCHYTFLRIRQVNQKPVALFRLDLADGAVDYHEWHIARDATGQLRFVDLYDLAKGELTSQSLRGFYLAAVVASDKAMAGKIGARERELVDASPQITQLGQDLQAKQFQQVLDTYKSLPPSVQRIKSVLFLRISAAEQLPGGDAEYDAAVADFQKWFPKDPALDLLQLAHLSSTKKYTEAHQALDRLTAFTGGDAHLCCQQGRLYLDANQPGDLDRALAQYKSAVAMEPGNSEGYWGVVTVYIKQHDYADVAAELTLIHHKLRIKIADLTKLPFYSGFVKSPEYTKWISE
jgi:tetratricopeptide (TPR) repeat protein